MDEVEVETFNVNQFIKEESIDLRNLELNKFYRKLDKYLVNGTNKSYYCNTGISDPKIRNLCYSLENRIFEDWNNICPTLGSSIHKCYDYLNYWLYGKLSEYNTQPLDSFLFYQGLKNIFTDKFTSAPTGTYNKHFQQVTYQDTLKNKKELYDFSEYYDYIISVINGAHSEKKGKYCQYVLHILQLYDNLKNEYSSELSKSYVKEFKFFQNKINTESKLTSLIEKCGMYYTPSASERGDDERSPLLKKNVKVEKPIHVQMPWDLNMNTIQAELPSKEIYDKLNRVEESIKYDNYCKNIDTTNHELKPLCRKIVRNLKNISENKIMQTLNYGDRCLHFIFWAYDEIGKKFNWSWRNVYSIPEAKGLFDVWSKVSMEAMKSGNTHRAHMASHDINRHCIMRDRTGSCIKHKFITGTEDSYALENYKTCLFYINCSSNECKEMKALYDYFYNFSDIKNKVTTNSTCSMYNTYLNYIAKLYEKYRKSSYGDCCLRGDCDDFFKCDEDLNPKNLQQLSVCGNVQGYGPRGLTSRAGQGTYEVSHRSRHDQRNPDDIFSYDIDPSYYDEDFYGLEYIDDERVSDTVHAAQDQSAGNNWRLFDFSGYKNKLRLFTIIGGISFLAFALYKYTPLGKLLNGKNRKKIQLDDFKFEENVEDVAMYETDYDDEISHDRSVYLGYYPSEEPAYY